MYDAIHIEVASTIFIFSYPLNSFWFPEGSPLFLSWVDWEILLTSSALHASSLMRLAGRSELSFSLPALLASLLYGAQIGFFWGRSNVKPSWYLSKAQVGWEIFGITCPPNVSLPLRRHHKFTWSVVLVVVGLNDFLGLFLKMGIVEPLARIALQDHQLVMTLNRHPVTLASVIHCALFQRRHQRFKGWKSRKLELTQPRLFVDLVGNPLQ